MSGFSPEWLDLREGADHRARNAEVASALREAFASREAATVVDLGCGTGSNLRATAPLLPRRQHWTLVDHDGRLLETARERLAAWADRAEPAGDDLNLSKDGKFVSVSFRRCDLVRDLESALGASPDLVTAAALFDLCSAEFITRFAQAAAGLGAAVYAVLTYDGREEWRPPHPADAGVLAAFLRHQARDKGFGPSAGPRSGALLAEALTVMGYQVRTGDSPWTLGQEDAALMRALAAGVASAALESGEAAATEWGKARDRASGCVVGHTDCLGLPPDF